MLGERRLTAPWLWDYESHARAFRSVTRHVYGRQRSKRTVGAPRLELTIALSSPELFERRPWDGWMFWPRALVA